MSGFRRKLREVRRSIGAREASVDITGMSYRRQIVTRRRAAPVAAALQKLRQGLTGGGCRWRLKPRPVSGNKAA